MAGGTKQKLRCTYDIPKRGRCSHEGYNGDGIVDGRCWQHRHPIAAHGSTNAPCPAGKKTTACLGQCEDGSRCMRTRFLCANGYCRDHQPKLAAASAKPPGQALAPAPAVRRATSPKPKRAPVPAPCKLANAPAHAPGRCQRASTLDGVKIQPTAPQRVTRAQYARQLRAAGVKLESDQDVYHIISSENGGADHPDNYHFVQNRAWNRAIGANHDHINCFMAGIEKAKKAVAISRSMGNDKGKKYNGPSAETLYKAGEDAMRGIRVQERRKWAELRLRAA